MSKESSKASAPQASGTEASASGGMTRREVARLGVAVLAAAGAAALPIRTARAAEPLVTDVPENAALVSGLQYVNQSAKPDQRCENCQLFQAQAEGQGKCMLFPKGHVAATGWCVSWAPKPS